MPFSSTSLTTVRDSITAPEALPSLVRTATMSTSCRSPSVGRIRMAARSPPLTSRIAATIESNSASTLAGARQDLRHLVQRRQVFLRRLEQVRFVLALVDLREELELGRVDGALHQRLAARFDEAERRGGAAGSRRVADRRLALGVDQLDHGRADPDLVGALQFDAGDALLVDEGAVGRLEVRHHAAVFAGA